MRFLVDGHAVHAATGGTDFDRLKPAIVFLHGAGMDHSAFVLQSRWFGHHGFAVLAPDLPGHGLSDPPALDSVADLARWLSRLLDQTGVKRTALVGHSLGGLVALEAAAAMPDRVSALALLGSGLPMTVNAEFLALAKNGRLRAIDLMTDWSHDAKGRIGGNRMPGLWLRGLDRHLLISEPEGALHAGLKACADYALEAGKTAAAKITCPALLVVGDRDRMVPAAASRTLLAALPKAKLETIAGSGHMLMGEYPEETLALLRRFLAPVPAPLSAP